jgi:hypothetical protein
MGAARAATRHALDSFAMSAKMSEARQHVVRGPSFTAAGYRPLLTPAHQVERDTGISSRIRGRRRKPSALVDEFMSISLCMQTPVVSKEIV